MKDTIKTHRMLPSIKSAEILQYLLWGTIGLCTTCGEEPKTKLAALCLDRVADSLPPNNPNDLGTRVLLRVYQAHLKGQPVEFGTIPKISLTGVGNWLRLFDSLHPHIRLRKAHYLASIALDKEQGSVALDWDDEEYSTVVCDDASLSTDTRSFIANSQRINKNLVISIGKVHGAF